MSNNDFNEDSSDDEKMPYLTQIQTTTVTQLHPMYLLLLNLYQIRIIHLFFFCLDGEKLNYLLIILIEAKYIIIKLIFKHVKCLFFYKLIFCLCRLV